MRKILILFVFLGVSIGLFAQKQEQSVDKIIQNIIDYISDDNEDGIDLDLLYEDLNYFYTNKINLNTTTKNELERLHFLSDIQIENILSYIYLSKGMNTIYELQLIDGLDIFSLEMLIPFVAVDKKKTESNKWVLKDVFRKTKHEFYVRGNGYLEQKRGYREKEYIGSPLYEQFRYSFKASDKIQIGLTAEKDPGEQFWGKYHKGFDSYSAYLQLDKLWKFNRIVLGDFRATFGQGLIINSSFFTGKSMYVMKVMPASNGITRKASADEINFFRGTAITTKIKNFDFTVMYSFRQLNADTTGGSFSTIDNTGIFRRERDWTKRKTVQMQILAANLNYKYKNFKIGATFYQNWLNIPMMPSHEPYKEYDFRGKSQMAASIDYYYKINKFNFFGETAMAKNLSVATINGVMVSPVSLINLALLHRYYSPKYDIFFAKGFGKNSSAKNENGVYFGMEIFPYKRLKLTGYADIFKFPHLKYNAIAPSKGFDALFQTDFQLNRDISMYIRGKYNDAEKNYIDEFIPTKQIASYKKGAIRYNINYKIGKLSFRSIVETNFAKSPQMELTQGIALVQDAGIALDWQELTFNIHYVFFDAKEFNNRFYFYERELPYSMYTPMLYGVGNRYAINIKMHIIEQLKIYLKFSQTIYADGRETIGTSFEEIKGNVRSELKLALKWKFNTYKKRY